MNKMKRQSTEWKKAFANDISDKRLTPKVYKKLILVSTYHPPPPPAQEENLNPLQKMSRGPEWILFQTGHTDDK